MKWTEVEQRVRKVFGEDLHFVTKWSCEGGFVVHLNRDVGVRFDQLVELSSAFGGTRDIDLTGIGGVPYSDVTPDLTEPQIVVRGIEVE